MTRIAITSDKNDCFRLIKIDRLLYRIGRSNVFWQRSVVRSCNDPRRATFTRKLGGGKFTHLAKSLTHFRHLAQMKCERTC